MSDELSRLEAEIIANAHSVALTADGDFQQVESYITVPLETLREWLDRRAEIARGESDEGD